MNPNTKVYAALRINGIVHDWGFHELKYVPRKLVEFILESQLDAREFSSMELRLSKRKINWESQQQTANALDSSLPICEVDDDTAIDEIGDITYGELDALYTDPIWTQQQAAIHNPPAYSDEERRMIGERFQFKYGRSKFIRLMKDE